MVNAAEGLAIVAATLGVVWTVGRFRDWVNAPAEEYKCWVCGEMCSGRARVMENDRTLAELYACQLHLPSVRDLLLAEHFGLYTTQGGESGE